MVERGLFTEAEPLLMTARAVCPDSEEALLTLSSVLFNLAGVRFECNRIKESLELCKQVLQIREHMLEPLDPLLGNTLYSIGIVYMEDGQLEEALRCCLKAVEIHEACERNGKHDGSPTGLSCLDVGLCYWKMGELELASRYIERGLGLFEKTTGKSSQKYGQ
jgi:tetratricopeptide (TPR) repeat protein